MPDLPARVTGRALPWSRDMALVAGATASLAPVLVWGWGAFAISAACGGLLSGAAVGLVAPWILDGVRGRVPLPVLASLGIGIGAVWGAALGAFTAALELTILGPAATIAAASVIGAAQLGAFWFPYTFLTVLRARTWPVVAATCAVAPLTGWWVFSLFL